VITEQGGRVSTKQKGRERASKTTVESERGKNQPEKKGPFERLTTRGEKLQASFGGEAISRERGI